MSNLSPSILSTSNLIYLSDSLVIWEHVIESVFQSLTYGSLNNISKLKKELLTKLQTIKNEFELNRKIYSDVLPVSFESKVRLVLSVIRVSFTF